MAWQGDVGRLRAVLVCAAIGVLALVGATARADEQTDSPTKVHPDANWSQAFIDEPDGTSLHADVLRPKGVTGKVPVILSIGPYFNHSGQTGPVGPVESTPFDPSASPGPSTRFYDFQKSSGQSIYKRGYAYVMVDLRGFGGSSGCLDWAGPGEQADVKAAVEWAASQPWSTGKVGMYGKSYDGVTGLIGEILHPKGLAAVVAQEPVYDMYRYLYTNRVRYVNSLATPALYDGIAGTPGTSSDTIAYNTNSLNDTSRPGCPVFNHADQQNSDHTAAYWQPRDFIRGARKLTPATATPLFMTQGFIEDNTKPDGAYDFFNAVPAYKRAWFGMWDHVRGNDTDDKGRLKMGRAGWFDEIMRFYDRFLKGKPASETTAKDPTLAVESSDGKWRNEQQWPPADSFKLNATLNSGTYLDHGQNNGYNVGTPPNGDGIWTFSPKFDHLVHFAGIPTVNVDASAPGPGGNLVVDVYDLDSKDDATLISRYADLLDAGRNQVSFDMYGDDWMLPAGHRLGVLVTSSNAEWWLHVGSNQQITVNHADIDLPFVSCARPDTIQGLESLKLKDYLANAPFSVDPTTVQQNERASFPVPGALTACKSSVLKHGGAQCAKRHKVRFKIKPHGGAGRIVRVEAYVGKKRVKLLKGKNIKRLVLRQPNKKKFTIRIVSISSNGSRTVSVRKYRRCHKSHPHTRVQHGH